MISSLAQNEITTISGFEKAAFTSSKHVLVQENGSVRYLNLQSDSSNLEFLSISGRVTAIAVSNDFSIFAIGVEEGTSSKIIVYACEIAIDEEKCSYGPQYLTHEMCISQGAEIIASLSILEEQIYLQSFDVKDGINNCTGSILVEKNSKVWQMSFCPADEGVLCALGGGVAYFLRANGGCIENFSTIQLPDVTCHDWSNDVNLIFGTNEGLLNVYRETILLEAVDIKTLSENVLKDAVDVRIICVRSTSRKFACQTASGIILLFDSAAESGPIWSSAKALILSNFTLKLKHSLSFDFSDEYLLYDDGRVLMTIPIRFLTRVSTFNGDVVTVRHCNKVICIKSTNEKIVTLDETGFIIVSSKITKRTLSYGQIEGAFFFTILSKSHELLIVTHDRVEKVTITLDGLLTTETILEKSIIMAVDSYDMSIIAILDQYGFMVFRPDDKKILMNEPMALKKDIKQILFSTDNKYLVFLTKSDHVYCSDISSGKTLWTVDYKLHFFQSMMFCDSTLLLLNQKFIVTRIKHGKDLSNVNMHASDVGFSITSEIIEGNNEFVFISTDSGEILCSASLSLDEPIVVKSAIRGPRISSLRCFNNELFVGYNNGSVGRLELKPSEKSDIDYDLIFCKFYGVSNLKSLLRDIDSERNMIRETTEKFVKMYTENKEEELRQIKEKFDDIMTGYKEKVKTIESEFFQSETIKKTTIENLKELYTNEISQQKTKYEKMIEDHIRKSLKQMEEKQIEIKQLQQDAERKREDTMESFHITETQLNTHITKLIGDIENNKKRICSLESDLSKQKESMEHLKQKHDEFIKKLKNNHRQDVGLLEEEIWNLKATCVQLNEQRDRISDENSKNSSSLKISKQQIEHLRDLNIKQEDSLKKFQDTVSGLRNKEVEIKKSHAKIQQKLVVRDKQFDDITAQNHRLKRRMQDIEARIEQLAGCVYNPRKLEHAVLNLLAMSQNVDMDERYRRPL